MKQFVVLLFVLSLLIISLVGQLIPVSERFGGFIFGLILFTLNLVVLKAMARRMLGMGQGTTESKSISMFLFLTLVKMLVMGGGVYVALVMLDFSGVFLVIGALSGLAVVTLASLPFRRHVSQISSA